MAQDNLAPAEASKIAEEAFVYGFPMVMNYAIFYEYFIDKTSPQYKAPPNQLYNTARVFTPQDTTIVTPNSDTPYSFVAMDLRAEPFVICNPEIETSRYFSVQLVDMYTFNFGYMGSRTTGNRAACNMVAGPGWKGEKPAGWLECSPAKPTSPSRSFARSCSTRPTSTMSRRFRPATGR